MRNDISAETSVIGSVLIDSRCLGVVMDKVTLEDFISPMAKNTYAAVLRLVERDIVVDPVSIIDEAHDYSDEYRNYLGNCMSLTGTAANIELYCETLRQRAQEQKLYDFAETIQSSLYSGKSVSEIAIEAKQLLDGVDKSTLKAKSGLNVALDWFHHYETIKNDPDSAYCKTGYNALDNALGGGMFNDEVYILAGRPGMGKTTQGIGIAENISKSRPVLFVSLEMSAYQIMSKRLSISSGVDYTRILSGKLSDAEEADVTACNGILGDRLFYVVDTASAISDIEKYCRSVPDLACVVIDYLGLIQTGEKPAPRYEEVTRISAQLKALAKKLHKPLLVLAQLNRENTTRSDKRPTLSDLRDSGAIEQDAGGVILLHRGSYYETDKEPPEAEEIELIIAKNRHAAPQTVKMIWHGATGQITEKPREYPL